jgi:glycosyltransferase involved in cell wall biosynthesis
MVDKKYTFHVLGLPHTVTNKEYSACAYTTKARRFCDMMTKRGHTVYHYGHEDSIVNCTEHITVTTNKDLEIAYGSYDWRKSFFKFDMKDHAYQTFYKNAITEIAKRKTKTDFLLPFWGWGHKPICDAFHPDIIVVEPGIGYADGQFAKFRIFESYAIRSAIGGKEAVAQCKEDWYHVVIPNYFDPEDFTYSEEKEDYFLFLGRVYPGKGIDIAYQVCDKLGLNLKIAGQGSLEEHGYKQTDKIQHIGYANTDRRKELMSKAKGFFLPSMFNEPFGGAAMEAMFSGCPIITTDWGVFAEYNLHSITGYRCRTFEQFCWAAKNIDKINPKFCRDWAMANYSTDRVAEMYLEYFQMVMDVYEGKGWYQEHPERENLDWLTKFYPGINL